MAARLTLNDVQEPGSAHVRVDGPQGTAVHGEGSLGDAHVGQSRELGELAGGGDATRRLLRVSVLCSARPEVKQRRESSGDTERV